jgi:hypothetical protein
MTAGGDKPFLVLPRDFFRALDGLKLRVLGELIGRADLTGRCYPSHAKIAADLKASRANVTRAINQLEDDRSIARVNKKRPTTYQISERFLVRLSPQRQARPDDRRQPSLLLPIEGVRSPPGKVTNGVETTPKTEKSLVSKRHPDGVETTPGRESRKRKNPFPSTEPGPARAREVSAASRKIIEDLNSGLGRASPALGPNFADPAVREAQWISNCLERMRLKWPSVEYQQAVALITEDAESPAARRLLERASAERKQAIKRRAT